jgi:tetratricopeptide (TPR) repeat protein
VGGDGRFSTLIISYVLIFVCLSLFALYQHFISGSDYGHRAHKPLLDPNNLATLFAMVFVPIMAFVATLPRGRTKNVVLGFCALLFFALLATQSRGALAAVVVSLCILFFMLRQRNLLIGVGVSFIALGILAQNSLVSFLSNPSVTERLQQWKATIQMIVDRPWLGSGFGTFALYYPAYRVAGMDRSLGQWAHNDPLQLWAEMGVVAPILFYALLIAILIRTIKALKISDDKTMIAGTFCGLLVLALMAHINFCFAVMPILIVAGILLALWHRAVEEAAPSLQMLRLQFKTAMPIAAFLVLILAVQSFSAAAGSYYFQRGAKARQAGDINSFIADMDSAEKFAPISFIDPAVERADVLFSLIAQPSTPSERREAMIKNANILLNDAARWNPVWARIDFVRGNIAFSQGQIDGAVSLWRTALRKNPTYVPARQALIQVILSQENFYEVQRLVQDGMGYPHTQMMDGWYRDILTKIEVTP